MSGCGCDSYAPGHNCHFIQAKLAGGDPKSWWPATIVAIDDPVATVDYGDGTTADLWRHGGFDDRVRVGEEVEVCERWSLLAVESPDGARWLSVRVSPTGGRSTKPRRDVAIRPAVHAGIVEIDTGEGIDILRARP